MWMSGWHASVDRKASAECEQGTGEKEQMEEAREDVSKEGSMVRAAEVGRRYFLLSFEKTPRPRWMICEADMVFFKRKSLMCEEV
jgi:hypothetical protein